MGNNTMSHKAIDRQWVEANSTAFSALLQQGYLVVPKSARKDRHGTRWIQMQKLITIDDDGGNSDQT